MIYLVVIWMEWDGVKTCNFNWSEFACWNDGKWRDILFSDLRSARLSQNWILLTPSHDLRQAVLRVLIRSQNTVHNLDTHRFCQTNTPCIVARWLLLTRAWFIPVLTPIIVFLEYVWIHIPPCAHTHTFTHAEIEKRTKRVKWKLINQTPSGFSIKDTQHVFNSCIGLGLTLGWQIFMFLHMCENFQICC